MKGGPRKGGGKGGGEVYHGVVKSNGPKYGFLECPPINQQYGRDVFVEHEVLNGVPGPKLQPGDRVSFRMKISNAAKSKGQPQAEFVWREDGRDGGLSSGGRGERSRRGAGKKRQLDA